MLLIIEATKGTENPLPLAVRTTAGHGITLAVEMPMLAEVEETPVTVRGLVALLAVEALTTGGAMQEMQEMQETTDGVIPAIPGPQETTDGETLVMQRPQEIMDGEMLVAQLPQLIMDGILVQVLVVITATAETERDLSGTTGA